MTRWLTGTIVAIGMTMSSAVGAQIVQTPAVQTPAAPTPAAEIKMWRLDCGQLQISDFGVFSDTGSFDGQTRTLVDSCYLIKHGSNYLLWDTGLPAELKEQTVRDGGSGSSVKTTIVEQLATLKLTPEQIGLVGISHTHHDHVGQAKFFPKAKLLIGRGDLEAARAAQSPTSSLAPWLGEGANVEAVARDKDVFGDGRVVMLDMRGHTPGHHALLVKLKSGPVLLSGDQFHSTPSYERGEVPTFNADRAQTLASHDRFKRLAANMRAKVIIQHEAADVAKLPAFPQAAE